MASSISNRLSREDYKKSKELEELRKTGAAPPELDEDGKMINPHIPQYIGIAPWYLNNNRPGLKHQYSKHFGKEGRFANIYEVALKGKKTKTLSKWQKGSCENCGAMTHKTRECVDRPRRRGAKLTNQDIAPDEILTTVPLDYDGKRDRWNGYDPSTYKRVIDHYRRTDKERRNKKERELDDEMRGDASTKTPLPGKPIILQESKNFKGIRRGEVSEEVRKKVEEEERRIAEAKLAIEKEKKRKAIEEEVNSKDETNTNEDGTTSKEGTTEAEESKKEEEEKETKSETDPLPETKSEITESTETKSEAEAEPTETKSEAEPTETKSEAEPTEIKAEQTESKNESEATGKEDNEQSLVKQAKSLINEVVGGGSESDTGTDTDSDTDNDTDDDGDSDPDDLKDESGAVVQKRDARTRTTVRNLRIREDTAKYLYNLSLHSAHYDPKTRSMRENPHPEKNPSELLYAGDNFVRRTGDVSKIAALQQFVWEATDRGNTDVHPLSNPSQSELLFEQFKKRKDQLKKEKQKQVLEKYGGEEHLELPDRHLLLGESEAYVEYAQTGEVIKGHEKAIPRTKYVEDVLENNHTEIWGSYFKDGKWGYACCQQTLRNTYCTGAEGRALTNEPTPRLLPPVPTFSPVPRLTHHPEQEAPTENGNTPTMNGKRKAETDLEKTKKKQKKEKKKHKDKKPVNGSKLAKEIPTEDEIENYHKKRVLDGDPMANYVDTAA